MKAKSLTIIKQLRIWNFGILCSVNLLHADQIDILTPAGSDRVEGNTKISWEEYSSRYQQVFDASLFKASIPNGGWIQIAYLRADGPTFQPSGIGVVQGAEISLSTTSKEVNSLSPIFANNVGSDEKVFLSRSQTIDFRASGINQLGVRSYGPILYYSQSSPPTSSMFFYDPSKGNLLMDFKDVIATDGASHLSELTLDAVVSPTMSSVFKDFTHGEGPATGTLSSKGLVVLFKVTPVPEPSAYAVCAVGILGLILHHRHNKNRKDSHVTV